MKFISKKQTGGLVNRYVQAHQYSLTDPKPTATPALVKRPLDGPHMISSPTINPAFVAPAPVQQAPTIAVNGVYPKVSYPTGTWAYTAITGEPAWQMYPNKPVATTAVPTAVPPAVLQAAQVDLSQGDLKDKYKSFGEAFNAAYKSGIKQFTWNGKLIAVKLATPTTVTKSPVVGTVAYPLDVAKPAFTAPLVKSSLNYNKKPGLAVVNKTSNNTALKVGGYKFSTDKVTSVENQKSKLVDHTPPDGMTLTNRQVQEYANMPEHTWPSLAKTLSPIDLKRVKQMKAFYAGK